MRPERKMKMQEMRNRLSKELKTQMKRLQMNTYLNEVIFPLLRERMKSMGVRSFFVHTISEYVKEQAAAEGIKLKKCANKRLFDTQLPFLAEGIIAVQYYENQILDGKGGLWVNGIYNMDRVHRNVIGGHFVKDFLYSYIEETMFPDDCSAYRMTMRKVQRIFQLVDLGQAFQDKWGTFESFESNKKNISISHEADSFIRDEIIDNYWEVIHSQGVQEDLAAFTKNYLKRISLTSGVLFELLSELIMDILDYHGEQRDNILKFSVHLGMTGQIVNDISDLVPPNCNQSTVSKIPTDAYADIRNNNVTLPVLFYFNGNINKSMQNLQRLSADPKKLLPILRDAIFGSQQVAAFMAQQSHKLIDANSRTGMLLQDMDSVVDIKTNRFYQSIDRFFSDDENKKGIFLMANQLTC